MKYHYKYFGQSLLFFDLKKKGWRWRGTHDPELWGYTPSEGSHGPHPCCVHARTLFQ